MPALYRSKSFRRYEESKIHLTDFIEHDNIKVLSTAAAQLLISTSQLSKWFKSSTGTICFLKDFTQKRTYYFRLYSLMQGKLWEQEIRSPFEYIKEDLFFHYLKTERFNYGFKFICEDEAERFFSAILKFSNEQLPMDKNDEFFDMKTSMTKYMSQKCSMTMMSKTNQTKSPTAKITSARMSRRTVSTSNHSQTAPKADLDNDEEEFDYSSANLKLKHKSRRMAFSIDRKHLPKDCANVQTRKIIDKKDISCPFRCSSMDLCQKENNDSDRANIQRPNNVYVAVKNEPAKHARVRISEDQKSAKSVSGSLASLSNIDLARTPPKPEKMRKNEKFSLSHGNHLNFVKKLLIDCNVPLSKHLIDILLEYISQYYGCIEKFKKALEIESEKNKLIAFIAASNAALITSKNAFNYVSLLNETALKDSPNLTPNSQSRLLKQNLFNSTASNASSESNLDTSTSRLISNNTKNNQHVSYINSSSTGVKLKINQFNGYKQTMTPQSGIPSRMQSPILSIDNNNVITTTTNNNNNNAYLTPDKTPIRNSKLLTSPCTQSNTTLTYRNQTPSPSRFLVSQIKSYTSSTSIGDANAPPKPPRRCSLKLAT